MPIRMYKIVHATGKSHAGGASAGLFSVWKVSIPLRVKSADTPPTPRGIAMQEINFFHWIFKKITSLRYHYARESGAIFPATFFYTLKLSLRFVPLENYSLGSIQVFLNRDKKRRSKNELWDSLLPLQLFNTYKIDSLFFVKAPQAHNRKKVVGKQRIKNRAKDERTFFIRERDRAFLWKRSGNGANVKALGILPRALCAA